MCVYVRRLVVGQTHNGEFVKTCTANSVYINTSSLSWVSLGIKWIRSLSESLDIGYTQHAEYTSNSQIEFVAQIKYTH